jgi:hypothetical protein
VLRCNFAASTIVAWKAAVRGKHGVVQRLVAADA